MASVPTFRGKKLALISAFAVLLVAAFGAGCKGFFQGNTLQSIAIQPSTLNILVNATQQFSAWGTYQDGTRSQITSGVVWTVDSPDVTITTGGLLSTQTVTSSAATVTGSAQGLTGTATVNVIGDVTSLTVNPTTQSMNVGQPYTFTFEGKPGPPQYITTNNGGTLTIIPTGSASATLLTCVVSTDNTGNPVESCTAQSGASAGNPWSIQMSYPTPSGGTASVAATANSGG